MLTQIFKTFSLMDLMFLYFTLLVGLLEVHGIMFHLEPNTRKCLREELQAHVLVIGEYEVSEAFGQKVDYVIRDSQNHILSQKMEISKGKFTFGTENFDTFEVCFISRVPPQQQGVRHEVLLIIKRGVEAKNYEGIAEAVKLKPLEVELKRLEDLSEDIVKDFSLMRKNEEDMRNTNGHSEVSGYLFERYKRKVWGFRVLILLVLVRTRFIGYVTIMESYFPIPNISLGVDDLESTNQRVLYFTVFSMFCLLGLATWQVFYLRNYFKAKKLIE